MSTHASRLREIAGARSEAEVVACAARAPEGSRLSGDLLALADVAFRGALRRTSMLLAELSRLAAAAQGDVTAAQRAEARARSVAGVEWLAKRRLDDSAQSFDRAAGLYVGLGARSDAAAVRHLAAMAFAATHQWRSATIEATALLTLLAQSDEADREPAALQIHELARSLHRGRVDHLTAELFAKAATLLARWGAAERADCVVCLLGCTLARLGQVERGLELIDGVMARVRGYMAQGPAGQLEPVPETSEGLYWKARAMHEIGRDADARDAYARHPWAQRGGGGHEDRVELATRLAELHIENERLEEARELLQPFAPSAGALPSGASVLLLGLSAQIEARLGRRAVAAAAMARAREGLARVPLSEDTLRARVALLDAALSLGDGATPLLQEELYEVERDAITVGWRAGGGLLERLSGHLLNARGEYIAAARRFREAREQALTPTHVPGWEAHGDDASGGQLPWPLRERTDRAMRLEYGVGCELFLEEARALARGGGQALPAFDAAVDMAARRNRLGTLFYALVERVAWRGADPPRARGDLERAVDILEGIRSSLRDVDLQIASLADKESVYGELLRLAAASDDRALAFRTVERAKSRALLEEASSASRSKVRATSDREGELRVEIVRELRLKLAEGASPARLVRIASLEDQLLAEVRRFHDAAPKPADPITAAEAVSLTPKGTALLNLYCDAHGTVVVPIVSGIIEMTRILPDATEAVIGNLLDTLSAALAARKETPSLAELHALLIEPLSPLLAGCNRILLVPHGVLHRVPFHALRAASGAYVLEDFCVAYAPSVTMAHLTALREREKSDRAVAVTVDSTSYVALPFLPSISDELRSLREAIPDVTVALDAGRRFLLDLEGPMALLHLACHGELNQANPLLSRLFLADGPVYAYELSSLKARPALVVLSACETGAQSRRAGDEHFGLVRPFLARGAQGVIASLWRVVDDATAVLMAELYRGFLDDIDGARRLQQAQLSMVLSREWAHPVYWAPFFFVGSHGLAVTE